MAAKFAVMVAVAVVVLGVVFRKKERSSNDLAKSFDKLMWVAGPLAEAHANVNVKFKGT